MPVPVILVAVGAISTVSGAAMGIHSTCKIKDSNSQVKEAEKEQKEAIEIFETQSRRAVSIADQLGKQELKILQTFSRYADYIEQIQNRPSFKEIQLSNLHVDYCNIWDLRKVSKGASVLLGATGGMIVGVAGGFAAAGATTSAVCALGTASTGIAIADLSGVAATNATLSLLGGGSLAVGGGGIALGSATLAASSMGIGLALGGIVFEIMAHKSGSSADVAVKEAKKTVEEVQRVVKFLSEFQKIIDQYGVAMGKIANKYFQSLQKMMNIIKDKPDCSWSNFTESEKRVVEITTLYVTVLYNMCKVQLTKKDRSGLNRINSKDVKQVLEWTERYMV